MLTVDIDQLNAQLTQNRYGHQTSVDPADILSVQVDFPLDDGLRIVLYPVFFKPGKFGNSGKNSPDRSLGSSGPDHIPVSPLTQNGRNRIDHDGFTGTGLAGEHIKSTVKGNVRTFNDRNILNMQKTQHVISLPGITSSDC